MSTELVVAATVTYLMVGFLVALYMRRTDSSRLPLGAWLIIILLWPVALLCMVDL